MQWISGEAEVANLGGAIDVRGGCATLEDGDGDGEEACDNHDEVGKEQPLDRNASIAHVNTWTTRHYRDGGKGNAFSDRR